jgi:hypothetical protein
MRRRDPMRFRSGARRFACLRVWLSMHVGFVLAATAASTEPVPLRYGFAPGQEWLAEQTIERETTLAGRTQSDRGAARFAYRVEATDDPERLRLDARMLSQRTNSGESPFDFSVIGFQAVTDRRGVLRGMHFEIGEAEPPELPGLDPDPVAFRQMLRHIAAAWLPAVYWLPELPEAPLAVGETFVIGEREPVGGSDPGVRMEMASTTRYTLRKVKEGVAIFDVAVESTVDASTAIAGVKSAERALGEAHFDLERGMWTRQEIQSEQRARLEGAPAGAEQAMARTTRTLLMRLAEPSHEQGGEPAP